MSTVLDIPVDSVIRIKRDGGGYLNPRYFGDSRISVDTTDLQRSMSEVGQIEPIVVCALGDGTWGLLSGDRRWTAARSLGWVNIKAVVSDTPPEQALQAMVAANIRVDPTPVHMAQVVHELMIDAHWTENRVAALLGKDIPHVRLLIELHTADEEMRQSVDAFYASDGKRGFPLSAFRSMKNAPKEVRTQIVAEAAEKSLTVAKVQARVKAAAAEIAGPGIGLEGLQGQADYLVRFNALATELRTSWGSLSSGQRTQIRYAVDQLHKFVTGVTDV